MPTTKPEPADPATALAALGLVEDATLGVERYDLCWPAPTTDAALQATLARYRERRGYGASRYRVDGLWMYLR